MRKTTPETFWDRVDIRGADDCWPWTGYRQNRRRGYGAIGWQGRYVRSHRLAYELAKGPIPDGLVVRHSCDNEACCNPAHLLVGTQKDNMRDASDRERLGKTRGSASPHAKLTDDDVRAIRASTEPSRATGRLYGVSHRTVLLIRRGEAWSHVS